MIRKAFSRIPAAAVYQKTVAVDLTPAQTANGLDPAPVTALLRALGDLQPQWRWVFLTTPATHEQYAGLETGHGRRLCLAPYKPELKAPLALPPVPTTRLRKVVRGVLGLVGLPRPPHLLSTETVLKHLKADLLFCPFGAMLIGDATVPTVAFWNDLSHLHHAQLLGAAAHTAAMHTFKETMRAADRVVCFSEDTCRVLLRESGADAQRVIAVRAELIQRLPQPPRGAVDATLQRLGLEAGRFVYYPAPFTEINNHKLLLVASGMLRRRQPHSACLLVCHGPPGSAADELAQAARQMGLGGQVLIHASDRPEDEAALLQGCRAVLFPWLESSRLQPVLQAVALGKPILCSDLDGVPGFLREVVLLFDPRKPASLMHALERAGIDHILLTTLAQRSQRQALSLGGPRDAARRLLGIFQEALGSFKRFADALKGIHRDGWTTERLVVTFADSTEQRTLRLTLEAPSWLPWTHQRLRLLRTRSVAGKNYKLKRGQPLTIERVLPREGGTLEFVFDPPLVPRALGLNDDERMLGTQCCECVISSPLAQVRLFPLPAAVAAA
jgi:glycosyltransferase involved in cell wall biosynthesis